MAEPRRELPSGKVHFDGEFAGHFRVDLHLDLAGPRVRAGLEHALRDAVRTGRLAPGTRLPSSRTLASDLGLARNTVADAYGQLVAEGWLIARHGPGTWVADRVAAVEAAVAADRRGDGQPPRYDLRRACRTCRAFPRPAWLAAARRALAVRADDALGYADPRGRRCCASALAEYLARARGVACEPGSDRRLRRLHPGAEPAVPGAARARRRGRRDGGVRPPPTARSSRPAASAARRAGRRRRARSSATSATPARCC